MKRFVLLFTFLATIPACFDGVSPEERGIEVVHDLTLRHQDAAMLLFERMVDDYYGTTHVVNMHRRANIFWTDTPCPKDTTRNAVVYRGDCYHGLTFTLDEIYVATNPVAPTKICKTGLIHEYAHAVSIAINGGDGDVHHRNQFFWAMADEAQTRSCLRSY